MKSEAATDTGHVGCIARKTVDAGPSQRPRCVAAGLFVPGLAPCLLTAQSVSADPAQQDAAIDEDEIIDYVIVTGSQVIAAAWITPAVRWRAADASVCLATST